MAVAANKRALTSDREESPTFIERLSRFPWGLLIMLMTLAGVGLLVLYSAVGGGENFNLLMRQGARFGISVSLMFIIALSGNHKFFRRYAYLGYVVALLLLVAVFVVGQVGMGARRWLDLGVIRLQPSELMKVFVVLALARFLHDRAMVSQLRWHDVLFALMLIALPMAFIIKQPDLGTAIMVGAIGAGVIFLAGLSWKSIAGFAVALGGSLPLLWNNMHEYQRRRVLTLFSPEEDPLGAGYHIIQSKIAVGSGGLLGKGYMQGSQSHLNFLPEQHTDFIFSVLAEEWGFLGALILLLLYSLIIVRGLMIAYLARDRFGLLLASGMTLFLMFHVVINIGMVLGLLPVVGIPLPLISYGGSSMMSIMVGMGLLAHVSIHAKHHGRSV